MYIETDKKYKFSKEEYKKVVQNAAKKGWTVDKLAKMLQMSYKHFYYRMSPDYAGGLRRLHVERLQQLGMLDGIDVKL